MTDIREALALISLEKYSEAFVNSGFSGLEDLTAANASDLDRFFDEIGMLKGHTFKLKKMIEDAKSGAKPKGPVSQPPPASIMPSNLKPKPEVVNSVKAEGLCVGKNEVGKIIDGGKAKEIIDKCNIIKEQIGTILTTRDSVMRALKQLVELDLNPYSQAIDEISSMQNTVRETVQTDIEMVN